MNWMLKITLGVAAATTLVFAMALGLNTVIFKYSFAKSNAIGNATGGFQSSGPAQHDDIASAGLGTIAKDKALASSDISKTEHGALGEITKLKAHASSGLLSTPFKVFPTEQGGSVFRDTDLVIKSIK